MPTKATLIWLMASVLFVGVGVFCFAVLITDWREYHRTASWVPVDASIDWLALRPIETASNHSSENLVCRYTYIVDGKEYHGTRVGIINGGVSGDEINGRKYFNVLQKPWQDHTPVTAFVNPEDPNDALLIREFDGFRFWGLLLSVLAFGGVPIVCWWGYFRMRATRKAAT